MRERPEIRLIREALEGVLAPEVTSSVLFEALSAYGSHVPRTPKEILLLVNGPLRDVLVRKIGRGQGSNVVRQLADMIRDLPGGGGAPDENDDGSFDVDMGEKEDTGTAPLPLIDIPVKFEGEDSSPVRPAVPTPAVAVARARPLGVALKPDRGDPSVEITIQARDSKPAESKFRETEVTAKFAIQPKAVAVMVVASGLILEQRLAAALGPVKISPFTVGILERFEREANNRKPPVVILDATDFPPIDAEDVAAAMSTLPLTTVKAIWGIDLPYGRIVSDTMKALGVTPTPFDRQEGIDPLLDVVRSRRG